jgi:hypothetical protein
MQKYFLIHLKNIFIKDYQEKILGLKPLWKKILILYLSFLIKPIASNFDTLKKKKTYWPACSISLKDI